MSHQTKIADARIKELKNLLYNKGKQLHKIPKANTKYRAQVGLEIDKILLELKSLGHNNTIV